MKKYVGVFALVAVVATMVAIAGANNLNGAKGPTVTSSGLKASSASDCGPCCIDGTCCMETGVCPCGTCSCACCEKNGCCVPGGECKAVAAKGSCCEGKDAECSEGKDAACCEGKEGKCCKDSETTVGTESSSNSDSTNTVGNE